jgi:hypothetical protein
VDDIPHDAGNDRDTGAERDLRQHGEQAAGRRDDVRRKPASPRNLIGACFLFRRDEGLRREVT